MLGTMRTLYYRRQLLIKAGLGALPLLGLPGCSKSTTTVMPEGGNSSGTGGDGEHGGADWAAGGTAAATESFPPENPFGDTTGSMCSVTRAYTQGPCYFSPDDYRQDISEGELGVPMVIALKVVDAECNPVVGADVDIWHCNRKGVYTADSSNSSNASRFNTGFCAGNDSEALASSAFRGVQVTNEQGIAYFKSCFPGWYPGRTVHIHFKIVNNGVQSLVSQFCFADNLSNQIYLHHPDYTGEAMDTSNATDGVFGSDVADYQLAIKKTADNAMLAYKIIQLSESA